MEENKNLTEGQEEKKTKLPKIFIVLRIIAGLLIAVGIVLFILSFTLQVDAGASMGIRFGGMTCFIFGFVIMFWGLAPSIQKTMIKTQKHIVSENKEDLKDIANVSADISKDAVKTTAGAVKEGLTMEKMFCKHCGKEIDKDSKYCQYCGKEQ